MDRISDSIFFKATNVKLLMLHTSDINAVFYEFGVKGVFGLSSVITFSCVVWRCLPCYHID